VPATVTVPSERAPRPAAPSFVPADLLLVQPTTFCNIDCSYCYLANRSDKKRMSAATLQALAAFVAGMPTHRPPLALVWHAGEPLTVPVAFYEAAFERLAAQPLRQHIQTNAVLINDAWCALFKQWHVHVGVSIDGPKWIHDAHRVDRAGRGTFDRVMGGIAKLREHEIPFSILAVLTADTMAAADEMWDFIVSLNPARGVGFLVEEQEGIHDHSSMTGGRRRTAFRRFMTRLAELRARDRSAIRIRELDNMRDHLVAPSGAEVAKADNRPGAIVNIDVDGNVATFSPELMSTTHPRYGTFSWGNVHTHGWADIARDSRFQRVYADIEAGVELCRQSCEYFAVCGGGCPSNKLAEFGTFVATETQHCRFFVQVVADVAIERLECEMRLGAKSRIAVNEASK
jgi:uncharacterized protein